MDILILITLCKFVVQLIFRYCIIIPDPSYAAPPGAINTEENKEFPPGYSGAGPSNSSEPVTSQGYNYGYKQPVHQAAPGMYPQQGGFAPYNYGHQTYQNPTFSGYNTQPVMGSTGYYQQPSHQSTSSTVVVAQPPVAAYNAAFNAFGRPGEFS